MLIDGTSCENTRGELANFFTLSFHDVIPIDTLKAKFKFEVSGKVHHPGVSVTSIIRGSEVATIRMFGDMLWALRRDHYLARSDVVNLITNDQETTNLGFRRVAVCQEDYFDEQLQENVAKGQVRLESTAGQLLDQMEDRGLPLPLPSSNLRALKRNYEILAYQVHHEDSSEEYNFDNLGGPVFKNNK